MRPGVALTSLGSRDSWNSSWRSKARDRGPWNSEGSPERLLMHRGSGGPRASQVTRNPSSSRLGSFQLSAPLYAAGAVVPTYHLTAPPLPLASPAVCLDTVAPESVNVAVMFSLRAAGIFSTTMEAILYGYAVFMFTLAMWILLRDRHKRHVNYYMVFAGCTLLTLATAEMAVNIARVYQGFLSKGPDLQGGAEAYFADVSEPTFVLKSCLYNAQTLVLDAVVIYRTYVVWQNWLICVLPIIGWFGLLAGSIGLNVAIATASSHKGNVFAVQTGQWITAVYALSLATNISTTSLLAFKIWNVARKSAQYRSSNIFTPVLRVIIESGAIYSVTITAALISFVVQSNGVYVVLDMISPIISIVFNMLIIRIGLANDRSLGTSGATSNGAAVSSAAWGAGATDRSAHPGSGAVMRRRADGTFEMRDLKVEITQVVEHDGEYGSELAASDADVESDVKRIPGDLEAGMDASSRGSYGQGNAGDRSFAV
ncbi:hypothetical protein GSI_03222 [Ganoderma sinense ZZ0214-1]|uniref:Uncharacterized protein n=1 Tax=Ganoderma sinense ZZ0214-1 TaxID=1077348 RepID=A0A2G8SKZ9_9APHY|nr:hypothetical protein GSI_03222 [Ganoderma sinense ZZ0214-1]